MTKKRIEAEQRWLDRRLRELRELIQRQARRLADHRNEA